MGGADLIIGNVGIGVHDGQINQDLAERYGYKASGKKLEYNDMDNLFPRFRFFPAHGGKELEYTGAVTADAMMMFLKKEAKVYFVLKGTLRNFDKLAAEFVRASDNEKAAKLALTKAEAGAASAADK